MRIARALAYLTVAFSGILAAMVDAKAEQWRALQGWPSGLPYNQPLERYTNEVSKATNGRLSFTISGPEVVPSFEQLEPLQRGLFQLLLTTGGYHTGASGILLGFDAVKAEPEKIRSTGIFEWVDRYYQERFNVKLLALPQTGAFQVVLREPPGPDGMIPGRKIRATPNYHPLIRQLGGAPVTMPVSQIYPALERGVVDGFAFARLGLLQFKFHEAGGKYITRPLFGATPVAVLVNLDAFKRLSPEDQAILEEEGRKLEIWALDHFKMLAEEEERQLKALGVEFVDWGPNQGNIGKWFAEGVWSQVERFSGADGRKFRDLVSSKGMIVE